MELQSFVSKNKNYIDIFKINGLKVKKYKNLLLVKNYYDKQLNYTNENNYWKMYCRGVIIDKTTNKVVCLPPVKSIEYEGIDLDNLDDTEIQYLIDGTMINLFYNNDEWIISTRSDIGGKNKWKNNKSFKDMFQESCQIDYKKLNKSYSYSFVMKHKMNRNVSPVRENKVFLVEVYKYDSDNIERLNLEKFTLENSNIEIIKNAKLNEFENINTYEIKGYTIKYGNKRYKKINPLFETVNKLKPNMNNDLLNYIELRQNGNLKEYLKYFPEYSGNFNSYRNRIHNLSNKLYNNYKNLYIFKTIERKDVPYNLKPLLEDVHKKYLETNKPIKWLDIKSYIHNIPSKKLFFSLNYEEL